MQIAGFRALSLGSFADTGWIELGPGFNLFVGENNAGKSQLLKVFSSDFPENRHRSDAEYRAERLTPTEEELDVILSGEELEIAWLRTGPDVYITVPPNQANSALAGDFARRLLRSERNTFHVARTGGAAFRPRGTKAHELFPGEQGVAYLVRYTPTGMSVFNNSGAENLASVIGTALSSSVFSFDAQRYSIGQGPFSYADRLVANASNLPAVLMRLRGAQGDLFGALVGHLREIFSTVRNLSIVPTPQNTLEIRVWPTEDQTNIELSAPLNSCGTGIAQAIAILTVALTMERAVIVIDEIGSFLHPAATKALLRILQTSYPEHQYIVSTHSTEVIRSCTPSTVHLVRKVGYISQVEPLDLTKLEELRLVAAQLGVSMSDVFAADRIIWVEGLTEELCLPYLYERTFGALPDGIQFAPIVATGDFERKGHRTELIFEIYERLSGTAQPLVRSVTFGLDTEKLTASEKEDLTRRSRGRVTFLPRRNFECYLIEPAAIAKFVCSLVQNRELGATVSAIQQALLRLAPLPKFGAEKVWNGSLADPAWLEMVDGARLIKAVCTEVGGDGVEFRKGAHSLAILKRVLEDAPGAATDLTEYARSLVTLASIDS